MDIRNIMEDAVKVLVEELFEREDREKRLGYCTCDQCKLDVQCYVLNRVKPEYIVSSRGLAYSEKEGLDKVQRRADLIPNLVATVSGAANFEKSTLTEITAARASVGQVKLDANSAPTDPAKLAAFESAQGQLSFALSRLLVVVEKYPDLKATEGFRDLQASLEGTENRISVERRDFYTAVQNYNTAIKSFPAVFYAGACGFSPKPYFTATAGAVTPPKVSFDFNKPATATNP